jgi:cytochrome b subunit of formate dehydrogenase
VGTIHVSEEGREPAPVRWVRLTYQILIPVVIGLMALHHGADWVRKLLWLRLAGTRSIVAPSPPEPELRMYFWERIQHALLAVSFFTLVWTGFALKYPDGWWALPLVTWESAWPVRGVLHRAAGVAMIGVAVLHVATLAVSGKLRRHWRELIPRARDLREAWYGFVWRLGFLSKKSVSSPHGYIEKIEYWAVVWGTAVMAVTGIVLWANDWMLENLPKVWLDVATSLHFYEAVLATLAIVVWHLYSVIFDPEVYPMDPAWLTGKSVRMHHQHGEHAALAQEKRDDRPE